MGLMEPATIHGIADRTIQQYNIVQQFNTILYNSTIQQYYNKQRRNEYLLLGCYTRTFNLQCWQIDFWASHLQGTADLPQGPPDSKHLRRNPLLRFNKYQNKNLVLKTLWSQAHEVSTLG